MTLNGAMVLRPTLRPLAHRFINRQIAKIKLSDCPSVRPSVKRVDCDKTAVQIFYTIRKIIYHSFLRRRTVGGGNPFHLKFLIKLALLERYRRFSVDIHS